jgi:hypothetical protein
METTSSATDPIGVALPSIGVHLRELNDPRSLQTDSDRFSVFNREAGLCCPDGAALPGEVAEAEAGQMNREFSAMVLPVKAYVDGDISSYWVRPTTGRVVTTSRGDGEAPDMSLLTTGILRP